MNEPSPVVTAVLRNARSDMAKLRPDNHQQLATGEFHHFWLHRSAPRLIHLVRAPLPGFAAVIR